MPLGYIGGEMCPRRYTPSHLRAGVEEGFRSGLSLHDSFNFPKQKGGPLATSGTLGWLVATPGLQGVLCLNDPSQGRASHRLISWRSEHK